MLQNLILSTQNRFDSVVGLTTYVSICWFTCRYMSVLCKCVERKWLWARVREDVGVVVSWEDNNANQAGAMKVWQGPLLIRSKNFGTLQVEAETPLLANLWVLFWNVRMHVSLGAIPKCLHFHKCTNSELFQTPSPKSVQANTFGFRNWGLTQRTKLTNCQACLIHVTNDTFGLYYDLQITDNILFFQI